METTSPFDLNQAIEQWREAFATSPAFRGENLLELESHLRDSIVALQTRGLTIEESFLIASRRIGDRPVLAAEFGKMNRKLVWMDRLLWMLIGIQVWGMSANLSVLIARSAFAWDSSNFLALTLLLQYVGVAVSFWLCGWLVYRKGGRLSAWLGGKFRRRSAFAASCIAFCAVSLLVNYILPFWVMRSSRPIIELSSSRFIIMFLQPVAMAAATLVVARKRYGLARVAS